MMLDKDASASSRVRAADCVLDRAASAFEMEDLDVRLMQLEEAESQRQKRPH